MKRKNNSLPYIQIRSHGGREGVVLVCAYRTDYRSPYFTIIDFGDLANYPFSYRAILLHSSNFSEHSSDLSGGGSAFIYCSLTSGGMRGYRI